MKVNLTLSAKIRQMKKGESFTVTSDKERREVLTITRSFRSGGVIDFNITTRADAEGFKVIAI